MTTTNLLTKAASMIVMILICSAMTATAATFVVTNADDSGPGSLRDALTQANVNAEADTVNFDPAFFSVPRTITLASGELPITRDGVGSGSVPGRLLVINGPGADLLTISGNNASRIFYIAQYSNVVMSGMTVRDGISVGSVASFNTLGGGIFAHSSDLSLSNMVIRNNSATSEGGGIHLNGSKTTLITDSLLTENSGQSVGGGMHASGGLSNLTMRNVVVSNNTTENEVGGVYLARSESVTIDNCLFTGNRAGTASGGSNSVGALTLFQAPATVTNTTFSNNSAGAPPTTTTQGVNGTVGAIHAEGADMVFRRVTITGNKAHGSVGGIYIRSGGSSTLTVIDSTISNNEAATTFGSGPTSRGDGGGVQAAGGPTINIINTTIANNVAGGGAGILNNSTGLNVVNSTIVGNNATDNSTNDGGGGIQNDTGAVTTVQNSIIAGNTAAAGRGPNVKGPVTSGGYNIIGSTAESTGFGATGDQLNVDPLLDPNGLQNNGGATLTIALQPNSPAIDKGLSSGQTTDQRGVTRPTDNPGVPNASGGDGADIGAYEIGAFNGVAEKTLGNIATRLPVLTGENVLIGGFIVTGTVPKRVIIRALGPSLGAAGLAGALEDPTLELFQGNTSLAFNNNWEDNQATEIANTGVAPSDGREAAIVRTLEPGNYTAIVRSNTGAIGIGLVDTYDLDQRPDSKLANIATRGFVSTGDDVLIAGFIAGPSTRVAVRAIGPSLAAIGIGGPLQDPTLELVDAQGNVVRANDNWKGIQRAEIESIGIQPSDDRESTLLATLTAGNYTAVVRGKENTTGVAVVEVYNLE